MKANIPSIVFVTILFFTHNSLSISLKSNKKSKSLSKDFVVDVDGPCVTTWGSTRFDLFVRGGDNQLFHLVGDGSNWGGWEGLGGTLTSGPACVAWANGRIDIFARGGSGDLIHKAWSGRWENYESLGGQIIGAPAVSSSAGGILQVVVRGTDNNYYMKRYNNGWTDWEQLPGVYTSSPGINSFLNGKIIVMGRGGDGALYEVWYDNGKWLTPGKIGGYLISGAAVVGFPERANSFRGFSLGPDNNIWEVGFESGYKGWSSVGNGSISSAPTGVSFGYPKLHLFARGREGDVVTTTYNNGYSAWKSLGGYIH
jgi:hypothetical protein